MAAAGGNIVRFIYTGAEGEIIPREATHITVAADCTFVRARAFMSHPNIVEVICHDRVEKIERAAFCGCPSLRRVIMPGVKEVEMLAFFHCPILTDVECGKLEIIEDEAFGGCKSLENIGLLSVRIAQREAFWECKALMEVKFGNELERIEEGLCSGCTSLERITIPLKDGIITDDTVFEGCQNLRYVDLVGEAELYESIAALHLEEWRNDMNEEFHSINQILPDAVAGDDHGWDGQEPFVPGEKAKVIRTWIRSVLGKIDHFKAEHQRILEEATTLLELAIWKANLDETDESQIVREGFRTMRGSLKRARRELCITSGASIVIKNVLPFLQLKS